VKTGIGSDPHANAPLRVRGTIAQMRQRVQPVSVTASGMQKTRVLPEIGSAAWVRAPSVLEKTTARRAHQRTMSRAQSRQVRQVGE